VQLLRFIAAALVVLSHLRGDYKLVPYGDFGVDIFFVISGFIIYHVTRGDTEHFFTKRLIRIVPLYWLGTMVLATVALVAPSILNDVEFDLVRVATSLFFIPYWTDAHSFHPILLLGWTLNYELLFYFLFYLAMRISHRHRFLVCSGLLVILALSHPTATPNSAHFFWSGSYIIEFIYGMAIAVVVERTQFLRLARMPLALAAVAMALYCYLLYPSTGYLDGSSQRFLMIGVPSALLVLLVLSCEQSVRRLPSVVTRFISFLGDLSFATYIFHAYIMGVLKRLIGLEMNIYLYAAIVFACTTLVATSIFFIVEKPSRTYLTSKLARRKAALVDTITVPAV
jgi:peptidoglycan/LPS O-acetylase OafA/YrhL